MKKPTALSSGPLKAYPRKPPTKTDARWYWQVIYYDDRKQVSALLDGKPAHRRGTPREIRAHLAVMLEAGGWKQASRRPATLPEVLTVDGLVRLWLASQKDRRDRARISASTYSLQKMFYQQNVQNTPTATIPLDRLTRQLLQNWVHMLEDNDYAPRTVANRWSYLRAALVWGRDRGHTPPLLPAGPELPPISGYVTNRHTPTVKEIEATIAQLTGWRAVAVSLLYATGARVSEVTALDWSAWNRTERRLTLTGKTGSRTLPCNARAHTTLTDWWMRCGQPTAGPVVPIAAGKAGVWHVLRGHGYSPHAIRRRVSSILIEAGVDPKAYEAYMGHRFSEGLKTYAQARPERIQAAADLLGK